MSPGRPTIASGQTSLRRIVAKPIARTPCKPVRYTFKVLKRVRVASMFLVLRSLATSSPARHPFCYRGRAHAARAPLRF